MKYYLAVLALFLLFFSCRESSTKQQTETLEAKELKLSFRPQTISKQSASCATDSMKCARIKIDYLLAENAPSEVLKNINDSLQYHFAATLYTMEENTSTNLNQLADEFIKEYDVFLDEMGKDGFVTPWEIETESEVIFQDDKKASIVIGTYAYTGGAHPNHYTRIANFDVKTGQTLQIEDLVSQPSALKKIAEKAFRTAREIPEGESLTDAGFFLGQELSIA